MQPCLVFTQCKYERVNIKKSLGRSKDLSQAKKDSVNVLVLTLQYFIKKYIKNPENVQGKKKNEKD